MNEALKNDLAAMKAGRDAGQKALDSGRYDDDTLDTITRGLDAAERVKKAKEADAIMDGLKSLSRGMLDPGGAPERSTFDREHVKDGLTRALQSKSPFGFNMPFTKAALTAGDLNLPATGTTVSDVPIGQGVVALRELLQPQNAESGLVRYYSIGAGAADVVAEGALKPDLGASITPHDAELLKIAATFTFTDELVRDAGFLVDHVQREAVRAVLVEENAQIVAAFEAATGSLTASGTLDSAIDVLAGAIGATQASNGVTPSVIVMSPVDLATIRTAKASTAGSYFVDPLAAAPSAIHGVPLAATPAVASGKAYLVSAGLGVFYTRDELRVESGYTGDDWIYNRVTTRVEERVLPAIIRPSLLTKVTLTTA
ncbi:hypothetical protein ACQBJO_12890 [Janibacter sp. G349]|uniref:hypothetical protein n=1 Tax=Janibacter sp. G349 TaxID=3405424 RepID=UPI003B773EBC